MTEPAVSIEPTEVSAALTRMGRLTPPAWWSGFVSAGVAVAIKGWFIGGDATTTILFVGAAFAVPVLLVRLVRGRAAARGVHTFRIEVDTTTGSIRRLAGSDVLAAVDGAEVRAVDAATHGDIHLVVLHGDDGREHGFGFADTTQGRIARRLLLDALGGRGVPIRDRNA